ncbi:hypothetical protein [Candidatus Borreliella tachyglossi]|uniref:hypothetical protein n=1 Tax=Candidatus Borreliella tachyglossi TaxID=1964448 RepID=UPI00404312DF
MTNKILISLFIFITPMAYGQNYFISDVFFNKYQEIYEIPKTGFYIEYEKFYEVEKFSLFKDLQLIKYKTIETTEDTKKIAYYNEKDIKTKEEIYDNLHNKIQEIKYSTKGIILESVNYFYTNNDLTYKEIQILDKKPKKLYYTKDTDGKLLKITGSDFQVWNYGVNGELKSTYFDIKKSKTKVITYDENKRHLESITLAKNKIQAKEKNEYLDDKEIINTLEEGNIKTISKYQGTNLIRKEIYENNELIKTSDFEYNASGIVTVENVTTKEKKKEFNTKTEYEYNSDNKLMLKRFYENDLITLKTEYFSDSEYEQEIYYDGQPIFKVRYKNDEIIEEINKDIARDDNEIK